MRIAESQLRRIIREELNEDLEGFKRRTAEINYSYRGDNFLNPDTTFRHDPEIRAQAKSVKRAWAAEADHAFMNSLIKVHWLSNTTKFDRFVKMSGRNEVSAKGYLPGEKIDAGLGDLGVMIQGRVTLAANSQDAIYSGMSGGLPDETHKYFKSSGTPKRARNFNVWSSYDYILDRQSFNPSRAGVHNELIVDNWRPIGIIVDVDEEMFISFVKDTGTWLDWKVICEWALKRDLPIYDINMKRVPDDEIKQALSERSKSSPFYSEP